VLLQLAIIQGQLLPARHLQRRHLFKQGFPKALLIGFGIVGIIGIVASIVTIAIL